MPSLLSILYVGRVTYVPYKKSVKYNTFQTSITARPWFPKFSSYRCVKHAFVTLDVRLYDCKNLSFLTLSKISFYYS